MKESAPGYVGYGEGAILTEAVPRRPYSVVLLDEVENTIIILTSNLGTGTYGEVMCRPETIPAPEGLVQVLKPQLNRIFKPAFLWRLVIVPYRPIQEEALNRIIVLKLAKIHRRIGETHKLSLTYDGSVGGRGGPALHGS